jgi:putative two-component system response regulator
VEQRKHAVVIGEDDEPIVRLLRDAINDEPAYQAVIVPDGALVLETVRQVHADPLIREVMMPGLSGIEVYDRVRANPGIRHMPVLFVTAAQDFKRRFAKVRSLCPA